MLPKPFTKEGLLSMLQKHLSKLVAPAMDIDRDHHHQHEEKFNPAFEVTSLIYPSFGIM